MIDSNDLKIILHNLLLNSNKFTSNRKIAVDAILQNDIRHITVSGDGVSMDDKLVTNLNNMKTGYSDIMVTNLNTFKTFQILDTYQLIPNLSVTAPKVAPQ